jgi:hypothetical protein
MPLLVPCTPNGSASWRQRTSLDGRDYVLRFRWNQRDGHWFLSIADPTDVVIASGIKLVTDFPLLLGVVDARRPPGELFVSDAQGRAEDPGFADLGARFLLRYMTRAELGR